MIPSTVERKHIIEAVRKIDLEGFPPHRGSNKFFLMFEGKRYPPKYAISLANKFANGKELDSSKFNGGQETNNFLKGLGFDIVEAPPSIDPIVPPPNEYSDDAMQTKHHNERCPDCKATVKRMLEKIYGDVKPNHKFNIGTNPENFRDMPHYKALKRIFTNLQNYRGHKNFVYTATLPNCDYFVPDPGFVVEFDESQHFTIPRKIALLSYPYKSKSGFSFGQWAFTCDKTRATDNDPYYRDEQRAWYDTLRDFLPELLDNLEPTVRLYSKEMQWCSLDPDNPTDVARFESVVDSRRKNLNGWVATVTLQSNDDNDHSNDERMRALSEIVDRISRETHGEGVILFPGGWFYTNEKEPNTIYNWAEKQIGDILEEIEENVIVCVGIDGTVDKEKYAHDQIGIAVDKAGIIAMGKKFHPAPQELGHVELATDYLAREDDKSRIFELNGVKYFMCVCYDTYGIRHKNLPNPCVDVVLNLVHCFHPPGKGPSGASYFARHGFAGASREWNCPVFGTAVFFNRGILENWPTGVYWNIGDKSTRDWSYSDNPVKYEDKFEMDANEDIVQVRIYDLATI